VGGIFHRISQHFEDAALQRRTRDAARNAYVSAVNKLAEPGADVDKLVAALPDSSAAEFKPDELRSLDDGVFRKIADSLLADDQLTEDEERALIAAGSALGVDTARLNREFSDVLTRLVVAQVNDGRLPVLDSADIILQKGEVAHAAMTATLMKWRTVREWQGGSSGFSFRIAKGVTYRTGRTRGHLVDAGQQLVVEDTGILTLTSKRAVFNGSKRTLQFAYPKLVDVQVFTDGLRLAVSNRQTPSTFKFAQADAAAAIINAAAQKLM
jgi:hypothetical protein